MHITHHDLPFGGIRASGIGAYHGTHSFFTFSHMKSILDNPTVFDPPVRYLPFTSWKERFSDFYSGSLSGGINTYWFRLSEFTNSVFLLLRKQQSPSSWLHSMSSSARKEG